MIISRDKHYEVIGTLISPVLGPVLPKHGVHVHPVHLQVLRLVQEGELCLGWRLTPATKFQMRNVVSHMCNMCHMCHMSHVSHNEVSDN